MNSSDENFTLVTATENVALYRVGNTFFCAETDSPQTVMSLSASWDNKGFYVFPGELPTAMESFLTQLQLLRQDTGGMLRFLWLQNPEEPVANWQTHAFFCSPANKLIKSWGMRFDSYSLIVPPGMQFACGPGGFSGDRLTFAAHSNCFDADSSGFQLTLTGALKFAIAIEKDSGWQEDIRAGLIFSSPEKQFHNPILRNAASCFHLECCLHPLTVRQSAPVFRFPAGLEFDSNFTTPTGKALRLTTTADSGLTFQRCIANPCSGTVLYLAPCGGFLLNAPEAATVCKLLPGAAGTEYMELPATALHFIPDGAAHLTDSGFTTEATASYVKFPTGTSYYSEPENAPLFTPDDDGALKPVARPLLTLEDTLPPVPLWPVRGGDADEALESAISLCRFELLTRTLSNRPTDTGTLAVTPQGVLVELSERAWHRVILANDSEYLALNHVDAALRGALQSTDATLLFTESAQLAKYVAASDFFSLTACGWEFLLNPACWTKSTVLLIKYGEHQSARELLQKKPVLAESLHRCFDRNNQPRQEYAEFLEILDDRHFTGIILLNCKVRLAPTATEVDPDLKNILAGLPGQAEIRAHHLLIRTTGTILRDNRLVMMPTRFSAMIDYEGGAPLTGGADRTATDYRFTTVALSVWIRDSVMQAVSTASELMLNTLFGQPCAKEGEGGNCLLLDGSLKQGDGQSEFHYALRSGGRFLCSDSMLEEIWIDRAVLCAGMNFVLSGGLLFRRKSECDFFSYGRDTDKKEYPLAFDGLQLFRSDTDHRLRISYAGLTVQPGTSRPNSLAARFPCKLQQFFPGPAVAPETLGYRFIDTPLPSAPPKFPWFGLIWKIQLGTFGGLAAPEGVELELLTAWDATGCYVGMRLPSILPELQGLVKLDFHSVSLGCSNDGGQSCYFLRLNQFSAQVFCGSFPPGNNKIELVADSTGKKLGWRAEYRPKRRLP